jgi:hypothetical protein
MLTKGLDFCTSSKGDWDRRRMQHAWGKRNKYKSFVLKLIDLRCLRSVDLDGE